MKKLLKASLSLVLCAALLVGILPTVSAVSVDAKRAYTRLADLGEMEQMLLSDSEARAAEYPDGAMMIVETSAELEMDNTYAIDIFRQGGTKSEAKIKLSTIDLTAGYGETYRLYLTDDLKDKGVEGEKSLYYYKTDIPYVAREGEKETRYMTRDNVEDLDAAKESASEINDLSSETMPHSTETVLTFAPGEDRKTVFVETMTPGEITDDLEFMLTLSEPENCSISASVSGVYKIIEKREKPEAKLEISSVGANPKDGEAFVSVTRTGNLGGYDSFRVTTTSGTAKADEDYEAVAQDYRFIPNLSEIRIPVTVLDGAADGESFTAELSDLSGNATAVNTTATVTFDASKEVTSVGDGNKRYVTDMTYVIPDGRHRGYEYVDLTKFSRSTNLGNDSMVNEYKDHTYTVGSYNGELRNHAISSRSNCKTDFAGVKNIHYCFDNVIGSVYGDDGAVYIGNSDPLSDGDRECKWISGKSNCDHWDMINISTNHITRNFSLSDKGVQYIYLIVHKCSSLGWARARFHDYNNDSNCSFRLDLEAYDVTMLPAEKVKMYNNGTLEERQVVSYTGFTNPGDSAAGNVTHATFYRHDSTVISSIIDSAYGSSLSLKGIRLVDPTDASKRSDLITLSGGQFKLTPEFIRTYSKYIKNNKINILPCYEFDTCEFSVESYSDPKTGVTFTVDKNSASGHMTVNGRDYGTVTWSSDSSRNGKYYDGDIVRFTYQPSALGVNNSVNYGHRQAKVKSDLPNVKITTDSDITKNVMDVKLADKYFSVTPILVKKDADVRLVVSNPDNGDFTSKGTKYAETNSNGSVTVSGIKTEKIDQSFSGSASGSRLDFTAKPNAGYYAVWKYVDSASHKEVTRLGNSFNFIVQNPFFINDNFVQLTFEKTTATVEKPLKGKIYIPDGTILHPATSGTTIKNPAAGAYIYMDGYVGQADKNGQFLLKETEDGKEYAKLQFGAMKFDERNYTQTNRALVIYNSNAYVVDVTMKLASATKAYATAEIVLDSSVSTGVIPTRVVANNTEISGTYGDTITLVSTLPVNFTVDFDARNIPADKPVNLARWIFESESGMERSHFETEIRSGSTVAYYSAILSEKAKQGDKMFIEFYHKGYDSHSNEVRTTYGRYEVGYKFVNPNTEMVMNYMPDIGYYDDPTADGGNVNVHRPHAPGIGPVSPMFSIYGFMPIYSDAKTGSKDSATGKDLYCLEIGIQFSIARSKEKGKEGKWDVLSVSKQWDKFSKAMGNAMENPAQNMNTSTKISIAVTFAYQLDYYTADNGARHYTQSCFLLGAKFGFKISIPFTVVAVPCFVYIDISLDNVGYLVRTPNKFTPGYLTSKTLDNSYYYDTHGVFQQNFVLKFGLGVGWDGIASVGGHFDFNLESTIKGSNRGKMVFGIKGGVFAELLFFRVDQTWDIAEKVLLDTTTDTSGKNVAAVGENILNKYSDDLFANTKLSDMKLAQASDIYDSSVVTDKAGEAVGSDGAAHGTNETYEETNAAEIIPVMAKISGNRYMIANAVNSEDDMLCLTTYIYDTEEHKVVKKSHPASEFANSEAFNTLTPEEKAVLGKSENLVANVDILDCGDKLLLTWEACVADYSNELSVAEFLKSFKVMGMLYDKNTDQFTDFCVINDTSDKLADNIKSVYNPSNKTVDVFYGSIDVSGINDATTLDEVSDRPISLSVASADIGSGKLEFTAASAVDTHSNTVSDYSVTSYGDKLLLSYICADKNGRILETPLNGAEYDTAKYGTKNYMYLNRYSVGQNGALTKENELLTANENYVTANPEFVNLNYHGVENTLLFYKCNGRYGYQNINNLYLECSYFGLTDTLEGDLMTPEYITIDEDHTVGEDFKVYCGGDGELYALWTLAEGDQQQIWGRQFEVDEIIENTTMTKLDENNNVIYASDGSPLTEELSEPIRILRGYWGNKVNLTTGGIKIADGTGFYKGNFDAFVTADNHILSAYEAFDYDYTGKEMERINNRFVISEFDLGPFYDDGVEDDDEAVEFDQYYPNPGETVQVNVKATNNGFMNGRDVTLRLMSRVNGSTEIVDTIEYPVWLAGDDMEETFTYTAPEEVTGGKVELYYEIIDDGKVMFTSEPDSFIYGSRLSIKIAHADPESYFTDGNDTINYHVTATVENIGNKDYEGGDELTFIYNDIAAQADVMNPEVPDTDPFYINYGGIEIPEIAVGAGAELAFVSSDIPEAIFDKYGTNSANLKLAITPKDGIGWTEVKGEEHYNFLDEMGIGQFVKPEPEEITEISAEELSVPLGQTSLLMPTVSPASAADAADFTYSTGDSDIISVNEYGEITALKEGTATVTVGCGDLSTSVSVTVTPAENVLIGDVNLDGKVDISDATIMQRAVAEFIQLNDAQKFAGDVDRNGNVTVLDVTCLQMYLAEFTTGTGMAGQRISA